MCHDSVTGTVMTCDGRGHPYHFSCTPSEVNHLPREVLLRKKRCGNVHGISFTVAFIFPRLRSNTYAAPLDHQESAIHAVRIGRMWSGIGACMRAPTPERLCTTFINGVDVEGGREGA